MRERNQPKKRGRPATGRDELVGLRLPKSMLWQIEAFRAQYEDMTQPVALRILIELGLKTPDSRLPRHGLRDPKNSSGTWTPPKYYTLKPKKKTPKPPPQPVVEDEAPPLPQASPYGPRRKPHTPSTNAIKEAADRAEKAHPTEPPETNQEINRGPRRDQP